MFVGDPTDEKLPSCIRSNTPQKEIKKTKIHKEERPQKSPVQALTAKCTTHQGSESLNHETSSVLVHEEVKQEEGRGRKRILKSSKEKEKTSTRSKSLTTIK